MENLRRPEGTPVHSGSHRRLKHYGRWVRIEWAIVAIGVLLVLWALWQRVPF